MKPKFIIDSFLPEGIEPYIGSLDRKKMAQEARFALESFYSQSGKCKNPKNKWFKHYGGKGLSVHYSSRDFVGWWLHNKKTFTGKTATVSRINHNKGYSFDNINLEDSSVNSREAIRRNGLNVLAYRAKKTVGIFCPKSGELIASGGIREVARIFGVSQRLVQFLIRGKYTKTSKFNFNLKELSNG